MICGDDSTAGKEIEMMVLGSHNFTKKQSISQLRYAFCSSRQGLSHDMLRSKFWRSKSALQLTKYNGL